ncbi:MAG: rhodanese-like domain-containing protein [Myxococcota bacterium]|nr:rhodanese-like domain-containing protein [Myxococcota bacterium]
MGRGHLLSRPLRALTLASSLIGASMALADEADWLIDQQRGSALISAAEARTLHSAGAHFLDAREHPVSPLFGRIPGALSARWRDFSRGPRDGELRPLPQIQARLSALGLSGERAVVIYGDWARGWGEEGRLFWMLDYLGYPNLYVIEGGWRAWRAAGGEAERGVEQTPPSGRWHAHPHRDKVQRLEDYEGSAVTDQLIDTRSRAEFEGATPYGSPCGGHIPRAVNIPFSSLFEGDQLLSKSALRAIFEEAGINLSHPIVTYCTGGVRSGFLYLVLRSIGAKSIRNDDGSWWRWSRAHCAKQE